MSYEEIKKLSIIQDIDLFLKDLKSVTACFTGHRLQKLPWKANEQDIRCFEMKEKLDFEIEKASSSSRSDAPAGITAPWRLRSICTITLSQTAFTPRSRTGISRNNKAGGSRFHVICCGLQARAVYD